MLEKTYQIVHYLHEHLDKDYPDSIARREAAKKLHEFLFWMANAPLKPVPFENNLDPDLKELEIDGPLILFPVIKPGEAGVP